MKMSNGTALWKIVVPQGLNLEYHVTQGIVYSWVCTQRAENKSVAPKIIYNVHSSPTVIDAK